MAAPLPTQIRDDSAQMRQKILDMNYSDWMKAGNSKGSLHYLKKNAKSDNPFRVYGKVKERLDATFFKNGVIVRVLI